jgi:hypoxanthine phosphoribosyltransferase
MTWRLKDTVLTEEAIQARVAELAAQINRDYGGLEPVVACVLKGAWVFHADLVRRLDPPLEVDFIKISTYGNATRPTGQIRFDLDFSTALEGRHLLVVEDIVDTGRTLSYLLGELAARKPASVKLCALLDKPDRREVEVSVDYLGFSIPDVFVVGYGLDCAEQFRSLPHVASVEATP